MIEKVNPSHPDKIADRIAGALVDLAYSIKPNPRIAVEVLIGHGRANIIAETDVALNIEGVNAAVERISGVNDILVDYMEVPQDKILADNQSKSLKAGDNGIFRGVPVSTEVANLSKIARGIYSKYPSDGKYVLDSKTSRLVICQSKARKSDIRNIYYPHHYEAVINPLGDWAGGIDVDTGATNRKLGSDMGEAVTGGGLHGKDLSKADVSVNIWAHLVAQSSGKEVEFSCAIGDETIGGVPYQVIVEAARAYIADHGGFEKFAEWGLV